MNKHWPNRKSKYTKKKHQRSAFPISGNELIKFYREEKSKMAVFLELLKSSTIFQGAITCAFVGTTCYLWITGQQVPDQLWTANTIVLGFFFGAKSQQVISRRG